MMGSQILRLICVDFPRCNTPPPHHCAEERLCLLQGTKLGGFVVHVHHWPLNVCTGVARRDLVLRQGALPHNSA